jgi:YggT family protein
VYTIVLLVRIVLSWFPIKPGSPFASIASIVFDVTEPVLGPLRRLIPPIGGGGMAFDLSPLIVFLALQILESSLGCRGIF